MTALRTKTDTGAAHTPTPGPWKLIKRDTTFDIIGADGVRVLSTSWHFAIRDPYPLKSEALANACLAAAAPDMLTALRDIAKHWPDSAAAKNARAAISKAEGSAK